MDSESAQLSAIKTVQDSVRYSENHRDILAYKKQKYLRYPYSHSLKREVHARNKTVNELISSRFTANLGNYDVFIANKLTNEGGFALSSVALGLNKIGKDSFSSISLGLMHKTRVKADYCRYLNDNTMLELSGEYLENSNLRKKKAQLHFKNGNRKISYRLNRQNGRSC